MKQTFHLGSWRGVRIGAHWSLLIVALFASLGAGLWIGMFGWFMGNAARSEGMVETVDESLAAVRVPGVMSHRPTVIPTSMSLATVVDQVIATTRRVRLLSPRPETSRRFDDEH